MVSGADNRLLASCFIRDRADSVLGGDGKAEQSRVDETIGLAKLPEIETRPVQRA